MQDDNKKPDDRRRAEEIITLLPADRAKALGVLRTALSILYPDGPPPDEPHSAGEPTA